MLPEDSEDRLVLSERAAVEVLAYLVTAARCQLDEAAEYAPMRLLTAADKLAGAITGNASQSVRQLAAATHSMAATDTPRADRENYIARLDAVCLAVAECLLALDHMQAGS